MVRLIVILLYFFSNCRHQCVIVQFIAYYLTAYLIIMEYQMKKLNGTLISPCGKIDCEIKSIINFVKNNYILSELSYLEYPI